MHQLDVCLLKEKLFVKMIEKYPHLEIKQPTIIKWVKQKTLKIYGISLIHGS
jgi:hypothetical protein